MTIRPLKYQGDGVLQSMSNTELANLYVQVQEEFASVTGPGSIYLTPNTGTLIGTFVDTRYVGNVGESNVDIISVQYELYQDTSSPTGTDPPSILQYKNNTSPLSSLTASEYNELADQILLDMVTNDGPGVYVLQTTTPNDGGTWASLGELKDVRGTTISSPEVSYYLFHKVNSGEAYSVSRPLTIPQPNVIQSFNNEQIEYIAKKVRQRIIDSQIGYYVLQTSAPVIGTWIDCGNITDIRANITPVSYDAAYDNTYTGEQEDTYTVFTPDVTEYDSSSIIYYEGPDNYTGLAPDNYTGEDSTALYTLETNYTGDGPTFSGTVETDYAGIVAYEGFNTYEGPSFYTGLGPVQSFAGPTYLGTDYTGPSAIDPPFGLPNWSTFWTLGGWTAGVGNYTADGAAYEGAVYQAPAYDGERYTGIIYTGNYEGIAIKYFENPVIYYTGSFVGFFDFIVNIYTRGPILYTGPGNVIYSREIYYTRNIIYTGNWPGYFINPLIFYTGNYTANFLFFLPTYFSLQFVGFYTATFNQPAGVYTQVDGLGIAYYLGEQLFASAFTAFFTSQSPVVYTGPEITYTTGPNPFNPTFWTSPANYTGPGFVPYTSDVAYTGQLIYTGDTAYTGIIESTYTGVANYTAGILQLYLGPQVEYYTGLTAEEYTMLYEIMYDGSVINNENEVITTLTLWRRIG